MDIPDNEILDAHIMDCLTKAGALVDESRRLIKDSLKKSHALIENSERLGNSRAEVLTKLLLLKEAATILERVQMDWQQLHGIGDP
jgi:hypothetical protein